MAGNRKKMKKPDYCDIPDCSNYTTCLKCSFQENICTLFKAHTELTAKYDELSAAHVELDNSDVSDCTTKIDNTLLLLLNELVQCKCEAKEVSDYILESRELLLAINEPQTELHIITNELINYDSTVLASMAISANILGKPLKDGKIIKFLPQEKGVKYIYYCPNSCKQSFEKFRHRIIKFVRRDDESRLEVDGWVRWNYSRRNKLFKKLSQLDGKPPLDFINCLFNVTADKKDELVEICKNNEALFGIGNEFVISKDIENWLQGSGQVKKVEKVKTLDKFLSSLCANKTESDFKLYKGFTLLSLYNSIHNLLLLSEWQLGNSNLQSSEREKIFKYIFSSEFDDTEYSWDSIREQFENWLAPSDMELCGVLNIDQEIIDAALNNLVFCPIESDNIVLSYNFCLFITSKNSNSAAWYVTAEKNSQGSLSSDNTLFIFQTIDRDEVSRILNGYKVLISHNPNISTILQNLNSRILSYFESN